MANVTPRVDLVFKKLFGVEENKDLLISLVNSIVSEKDQVADLTLLNPYNPQNFMNDKLSVLDIKAQGLDGKKFNIEIQVLDGRDYDKRALYYWAKLYTEQLQTGADYSTLSKAIGIHILNFTSILEVEKYHNIFHIAEKESGITYFKDLELHTIELKKFTGCSSKEISDLVSKIKTVLDIWVAFLTKFALLNKDNLPKELDNPFLKKALTILDVMNFTSLERAAYEDRHKWLQMQASALKNVEEKAEARGIEMGIEIGEARGIEMGIEIGEARGIEIGKVASLQKIAISMLEKNIDINLISHITSLTHNQIVELQKLLLKEVIS